MVVSSSATAAHNPKRRASSLDNVPHLVGHLSSNGTAHLEIDPSYNPSDASNPPRSLKAALEAAAPSRRSSGDVNSDNASDEDYDAFKHDPKTVVAGGRGGGFGVEESGSISHGKGKVPRPGPLRLKSIPVTLNKLKEEGQYILTADDQALKQILREGLAREKDPTAAAKKRQFSDLVFTRQFTAFDRNSDSADSPFHGFFNLFWLGIGIYCLRLFAENYRVHGNLLGTNEIIGLMFRRDVLVLGISDGVMVAVTGFGLALQQIIHRGYLSWNRDGWIIQSVWEVFYIFAILWWTLFREWPWTHTVFFVLHGLVMLMKQHSWAFYNGYLSEEYKRRTILLRKLKQLEKVEPVRSPSAVSTPAVSFDTSYLEHKPTASGLNHRRQSHSGATTDEGASNISQIAAAIESGDPLDVDQVHIFERILKWECEALTQELKGKSTTSGNYYPKNLSMKSHYEYICLPTLVYELEYPRSDRIDWWYVAEKSIAVFGILGIMNLVSQTFIYPVVVKTIEMKEAELSLQERLIAFPWILSDLIFPFMMEYMMTWYVIWECILNVLAEVTYFADRGFYADWWNSTSWDQFARDWNRPVHNFLLRHVYHSSISSMKVNKYTATLITFFLSACVHELVMYVYSIIYRQSTDDLARWCLFKKLRGYLLCLQMLQIPLVAMSRSKWLRGKHTLGNLIFWIGIFTGPSLLCSLYLII